MRRSIFHNKKRERKPVPLGLFPYMEEAVGFEPTKLSLGCFQDSCLQPLGHTSKALPSIPSLPAVCQSAYAILRRCKSIVDATTTSMYLLDMP